MLVQSCSFWLKHSCLMPSISRFVLKTHPPVPMLIATKSCPDNQIVGTRVIVLWGGVNAPWFSWFSSGQGEYAFVGSGLAAFVSGGRALAVSFRT